MAEKVFIIDLLELHWIAAVVIQGYTQSGTESWVRKLNVKTRFDMEEYPITDYDDVRTVSFDRFVPTDNSSVWLNFY